MLLSQFSSQSALQKELLQRFTALPFDLKIATQPRIGYPTFDSHARPHVGMMPKRRNTPRKGKKGKEKVFDITLHISLVAFRGTKYHHMNA